MSEIGTYTNAAFENELLVSVEDARELLSNMSVRKSLADRIIKWRRFRQFTDMKRGELYPEVIAFGTLLRTIIANNYGLAPVQAQPNFGCNGAIDSFFSYLQGVDWRDRSRTFLVLKPTYFRYYQKAENFGFRMIGIAEAESGTYPVAEVISQTRRVRPLFVLAVTPNNPTGIPISDLCLTALLEQLQDDQIVVLDRTCVNLEQEISSKLLLERYSKKNLVIFHSFSKYHSLSHARIGFALVSNQALAAQMDKYVPFGLNLEAVLNATLILARDGELRPGRRILKNLEANRSIMNEFLEGHRDYTCSKFSSNYAVLSLPDGASSTAVHHYLRHLGISVMPGSDLPERDDRTIRIHCGGEPSDFRSMLRLIHNFGMNAVS